MTPATGHRRRRRIAGAAIALAGTIDLLSALTPPFHGRLLLVLDFVPMAVPQAAAALVALIGIALLLVTRGILRGQRRAWSLAVGAAAASTLLHLVKGFDVEEAAVSASVLGCLLATRVAFGAPVDRGSVRRPLVGLVLVAMTTVAVATTAIELTVRARPPLGRALLAALERLAGYPSIPLPRRLDDFVSPTLTVTGIAITVIAGSILLRPVVARRHAPGDIDRARAIVREWGDETLSYFALRNDKQWFFDGESVVSYAVVNGVALVSPDPAGPPAEREATWHAFRSYADEHGWSVAVLGATEQWLDTYRRAGMRDLYIGDEAIVDVTTFNLDGGRNKGLRQAVNRVARHGYRVEFFDPAHVGPMLQAKLRALMVESRQGAAERGFSMTLGRVFHPDDTGMLLAVCLDADDEPVAMCQFVPAPAIDGYSLDLMRRSVGDHPNGLTDFVVVETIRRLAEHGHHGLGLNFATMRAILAGEAGDGRSTRLLRWLLERFSESMQIDSLRRYNDKFHPTWHPRYAVYDAPEHFVSALTAVARAEQVTELPVVGRFLRPIPEVSAAR